MLNLAQWVSQVARRTPDAPAVIDPILGVRRSFRELVARTYALASVLKDDLDLGVGGRVAVFGRNSPEFVDLYLAAAASGTILFPLNWRQTITKNSVALRDCDPAVVIYDTEFKDAAEELAASGPSGIRWIPMSPGGSSELEDLIGRALERSPSAGNLPTPESLLDEPYLAVSTGGTTGSMKSAVHSQRSYAANVLNYLTAQGINESDVFLMLGQFYHVTGYMALAHLVMGRPVVVTNFEADATLDIILAEDVTTFFCIATMLPRLIASLKRRATVTPSVRLIGYGGAPMAGSVIREAAELFDSDLVQIWGMSEHGSSTILGPQAHRRALSGEQPHLLGSCGRAALLSDIAVLDQDGNEVPRDRTTVGELCHRGENDMLYYWNLPEETAALRRDGWTLSGDAATWDGDGYCYIVDRIKRMIISGGENMFPAEIERVIAALPAVAEVAVVAAPDAEWGEVVRAVVVLHDGQRVSPDEIRTAVETQLGSYKKPRIVDFVDALPMTPTGKIDLTAL